MKKLSLLLLVFLAVVIHAEDDKGLLLGINANISSNPRPFVDTNIESSVDKSLFGDKPAYFGLGAKIGGYYLKDFSPIKLGARAYVLADMGIHRQNLTFSQATGGGTISKKEALDIKLASQSLNLDLLTQYDINPNLAFGAFVGVGIERSVSSSGANINFTFQEPGSVEPWLKISDIKGSGIVYNLGAFATISTNHQIHIQANIKSYELKSNISYKTGTNEQTLSKYTKFNPLVTIGYTYLFSL